MAKQTDESKFDVRVLAHRIRRGEVSQGDYQAHLDALPDDAEESVETDTRFTAPYMARHYDGEEGEAE